MEVPGLRRVVNAYKRHDCFTSTSRCETRPISAMRGIAGMKCVGTQAGNYTLYPNLILIISRATRIVTESDLNSFPSTRVRKSADMLNWIGS
jgi:hypothetical protein